MTDEQLAVAYQENGDERIFEELLRRYKPLISKFSRKVYDNPEDVMQSLCFEFWRAVKSFPAGGNFTNYVYQAIVFSTIAMRRRGDKKALFKESSLNMQLSREDLTHELQDTIPAADDVESLVTSAIFLHHLQVGKYQDIHLTPAERTVAFYLALNYQPPDEHYGEKHNRLRYGEHLKIAEATGFNRRKVANTIQQLRKKLSA